MSKRSCLFAGGGVLVLAALGLGLLIWFAPQAGSDTYTVSVIAVVLSLLVGLLLVMAVAYKKLDMFEAGQPFGLPQGTIGAMIALFLLLIFVFLDVYIFRTLAEEKGTQPAQLSGLSGDRVVELVKEGFTVSAQPQANGTFNATVQKPGLSSEAKQLAIQSVTILGTLTTAVAAFYFGSKSAGAAAKAGAGP